jgi:adenylate cyclase
MGITLSELHEALALLGASSEDVDIAEANGTLLALAAERFLLPGEGVYSVADLADQCGVGEEALTKLWLALGFPSPLEDRAFTAQDVEALRTFLRSASFSEYSLHEIRLISASLARIADVFVDEIWDSSRAGAQSDREALASMSAGVDLERMERMLMYVLRRHLVSGFYRRSALHEQSMRQGAPSLAVGFADLAGFSTLSRGMGNAELTDVLVAFERAAYDIVASVGGRIVKTLGDGVLFTADSAAAAADAGLQLASPAVDLPPVHVGVAFGSVLLRQGDCFGPTVNLVSRIVGCAAGGEVVLDQTAARLLEDDPRFFLEALGERELKSFGPTPLWRLGRSTSPP